MVRISPRRRIRLRPVQNKKPSLIKTSRRRLPYAEREATFDHPHLQEALDLGLRGRNLDKDARALKEALKDPDKNRFLRDILLPILGLTSVFYAQGCVRPNRSGLYHLRFSYPDLAFHEYDHVEDLVIEWNNSVSEPTFMRRRSRSKDKPEECVVLIPLDLKKKDYHLRDWAWGIRQLLVGHPLHTFLNTQNRNQLRENLNEPEILHKLTQEEAIRAGKRAINTGLSSADPRKRRFLTVMPTGIGKTEVLKELLGHVIKSLHKRDKNPRRLHCVVADTNVLTEQLFLELGTNPLMDRLSKKGIVEFDIWGDTHGSEDFSKLIGRLKRNPEKHIVVVTTIDSLLIRVKKPMDSKGLSRIAEIRDDFNLSSMDRKDKLLEVIAQQAQEPCVRALKTYLGSITLDEAHHAGAHETWWLSELLMPNLPRSNSGCLLLGATATPWHDQVHILAEIFGNQTFWAYLDTEQTCLKRNDFNRRKPKHVLRQIRAAIAAGESSPLERFNYIPSNEISDDGSDLYLPTGGKSGNRYEIREELYGRVLELLRPYLLIHKRGLITVNTTEEAKRLAEFFDAAMPERSFSYIVYHHTGKTRDEIMLKIDRREIDFIISVGIFDEGYNQPDWTLWIDLSRETNVRRFIQRLGRILRLYVGKTFAEAVSLMNTDGPSLRGMLSLMESALAGQLRANVTYDCPPRPEDFDVVPGSRDAEAVARILNNERYQKTLERNYAKLRQKYARSFWNVDIENVTDVIELAEIFDEFVALAGRAPKKSGSENPPGVWTRHTERKLYLETMKAEESEWASNFWHALSPEAQTVYLKILDRETRDIGIEINDFVAALDFERDFLTEEIYPPDQRLKRKFVRALKSQDPRLASMNPAARQWAHEFYGDQIKRYLGRKGIPRK